MLLVVSNYVPPRVVDLASRAPHVQGYREPDASEYAAMNGRGARGVRERTGPLTTGEEVQHG